MPPSRQDSLRNEIDPDDDTNFAAKPPLGRTIGLLGVLHVLCCGIPLLLLSGVSLAAVFPSGPVIGIILAVVGLVGFIWYLRKGCATCPGPHHCRASQHESSPQP